MTRAAQLFLHIVAEGLYLAAVAASGDDKVIRDNGKLADIYDLDILGFLVFQRIYGKSGNFFRWRKWAVIWLGKNIMLRIRIF